LLGQLRGQAEDDTPLGQAQALLDRASEEPDEQRRVRLAKDALAISPDCADAYVLLAEHATVGGGGCGLGCRGRGRWPASQGKLMSRQDTGQS
jgi:hypothetical protein